MIIYSGNTYFWRRFKINYPFIFGFKEGTELGYREVFLVSSGLAVLSLAGALSNLYMELDKRTQNYQSFTELVPLGLVIVSYFRITYFSLSTVINTYEKSSWKHFMTCQKVIFNFFS
jgi:hypothetical protein